MLIVLSMVLPTLFLGACLYYLIFSLLADQISLPDVIARDIFPVVERINIILAISLPLLFVCILGWALFLSFKFLAPLERLEEDLKKIDEGDYSVRLAIDRDHDLRPVADIINHLIGKLGEKKGNS